jgi:DNA invertase Pin-like site-specific DNA recombinase
MIGYARGPSAPQVVRDAEALRRFGCEEVFSDRRYGTSAFLLGLERAIAAVQPGEALVVLRLEALAHDVRDLAQVAAQLEDSGRHLVSHEDGLDTRTDDGAGFFATMRMLARLEDQAAAERRQRKRDDKRARIGRPSSIPDDAWDEIAENIRSGELSVALAASRLGVDRATVQRRLEDETDADDVDED